MKLSKVKGRVLMYGLFHLALCGMVAVDYFSADVSRFFGILLFLVVFGPILNALEVIWVVHRSQKQREE